MSTTIYKKLLAIKKAVPYLQKDKKGFNYSYVTPTQVNATINPLMIEHGLLLITNVIDSKSYPIQIETKNGTKTEWKFDLDFIFSWVDVETGEKVDIPWKASGCNGEDKGLGSALTYAERYFILKQFNIPTDSDDPDNFQDKYTPADEKEAKKSKAVGAAIASIYAADSTTALKAVWNAHPQYHKDAAFKKATTDRKLALTTKPEDEIHADNLAEHAAQ